MLLKFLKYFFLCSLLVLIAGVGVELIFRTLPFWWQPVYQKLFDDTERMYVYVLGESTAEGVQYQEKISPAKLVSYQFNDSLQGKPLEIIELAESGTTIEYNYFQFYFETLFRPHKSALVLIYSGINEGTGNFPDQNFENWAKWQNSPFLSKLYYMCGNYSNSPQKYKYRYEQIIALAKKHNYKTVVSQLVGNVAGYDPEVFESDELLKQECRQQFTQAELLYGEELAADADSLYRQICNKLQQPHPFLLYRIANCKTRMLQFDSARFYFSLLPEISGYIGYANWKNRILEEVCNQTDVALARTFDRFVDSSENGLVEYNLINDAHHPNLRGYCIMSNELSKQVSKLYGESIKRNVSKEIVEKHFGFDKEFMAGVYFKLTEWFIYETLETQIRDQRLSQLQFYIGKYTELKANDESVLMWELLLSLFQENKTSFEESAAAINMLGKQEIILKRLHDGFKSKSHSEEINSMLSKLRLTESVSVQLAADMALRLN